MKVKEKLLQRVVIEHTPKYSSSSNGAAKRAIRTTNEQARAMRYDVEGRYGVLDAELHALALVGAAFCFRGVAIRSRRRRRLNLPRGQRQGLYPGAGPLRRDGDLQGAGTGAPWAARRAQAV